MKILFVNHSQQQCGVYQHGKRTAEILSADDRIDIEYIEINNSDSLFIKNYEINPDVIVYQWHISTMPWLNKKIISLIDAKQFIFFQEGSGDVPTYLNATGYIMGNMENSINNKNFYSLPRAIVEKEIKTLPLNNPIKIGSFGLATPNKNFDDICRKVVNEFTDAEIRLHLTRANMAGSLAEKMLKDIIYECKSVVNDTNIKLNITTHFVSDDEIINFLQENDVNLFFYDNQPERGIASATDYAIGAETRFGVNNSSMFRHILKECPELDVTNKKIKDLINLGNVPALKLKSLWGNKKLCDRFIEIINMEN